MGLPIGPVILATNANRTISDYFDSLEWLPRASIATLASAMDVGNPSNFARLVWLYGDDRSAITKDLTGRAYGDTLPSTEGIRAAAAALMRG